MRVPLTVPPHLPLFPLAGARARQECAQAVLEAACSAMGPACNVTADGTEVEIWGSGEANSCASSMPACVNSPIIATLLASQNTSKEEALHTLCDPVDDMESLPVTTLPAVALKNPCVSPDEAKQLPAFDADCASVMNWHTPMGQSGYSKLPNFPGYQKAPLDVLTDMLRNVSGTYDECASASKALLNLTCAMEYPMCDPSTHHVMYGASGTFSNCDTLFSEDPVAGSLAACAAGVPMADPRYLPMQALLGALPSFAPAMCSAFSPPEPSPPKSSNSTGEGGDGGESSLSAVIYGVATGVLLMVVVVCVLYYVRTRRQKRIDDFGGIFVDESEPLGPPMGVTQ